MWCEADPTSCVRGPKQIVVWNVAGIQANDGAWASPGYMGFVFDCCGFLWNRVIVGVQNDIFETKPARQSMQRPNDIAAAPN